MAHLSSHNELVHTRPNEALNLATPDGADTPHHGHNRRAALTT